MQCSINSSVGCPATHLRRRGDCLTVGAARGALCGAQCEACVQPLPGPAAQCTRCCATQRCIAPLQLWLAALRWPLLLSALRVPAGCGNWGFELHNSSSLQFARWDLRRGALEEAGRAKRSQCAGKKTVRPWGRSQLRRACPILPRRPYVCHKRTAADLLRCAQETLEALALDRSQAVDAGVREEARVALIKLRALVSTQALYTTRLQARRPVTCHGVGAASVSVCQRSLGARLSQPSSCSCCCATAQFFAER